MLPPSRLIQALTSRVPSSGDLARPDQAPVEGVVIRYLCEDSAPSVDDVEGVDRWIEVYPTPGTHLVLPVQRQNGGHNTRISGSA